MWLNATRYGQEKRHYLTLFGIWDNILDFIDNMLHLIPYSKAVVKN